MKTIAVLDFGGQYTHLIATRIRNLGIKAEIADPDTFRPDHAPEVVGIIFSGGPHSVTENDYISINFDIRKCPIPVLGLCYGHQLLAQLWGATVVRGKDREFGPSEIDANISSPVFADLPENQTVWMSHGDHVATPLPDNLTITASSPDIPVAAFQVEDLLQFGLQFHPEVAHTQYGQAILNNFIKLCTSERSWKVSALADDIVEDIRKKAGDNKLLILVSGGVDSVVALKLCQLAVGPDNIVPVHVDTGLMRLDESDEITAFLNREGFHGIRLIRARQRFLSALSSICDPEEKRRIIGRLFVEITDDVVKEELFDSAAKPAREHTGLLLGENWMLVQGTIYPDHVESGGNKKEYPGDKPGKTRGSTIKTHHNRVGEIESLIQAGRVIEPLIDLYKDEVRQLGRSLNLPDYLLNRQPFPGPGLGIRILCSQGENLPANWNYEQSELIDIVKPLGFDGIILPVRSVGVQGDVRTYLHPAAIWPVSGNVPDWDRMFQAARHVVNRLHSVNRVVWSSRPLPEGLKLEPACITEKRLESLAEIDALFRAGTESLDEIWQMPVISLPAKTRDNHDAVVIRPVSSVDAMTARPYPIPFDILKCMYEQIKVRFQDPVILYDLTSKPPGTIEWE